MALTQQNNFITEQEYLLGEEISAIKHELINGDVYAMSGASKNHERIAGSIYRKIGNFLENSPCEPFSSDVKVKVENDFFYPDAMVVCEDESSNEYYTESPTIIIEVLSKSTRRFDETVKRKAYQSIPALQEYLLIEQEFIGVEVCRRKDNGQSSYYSVGDTFILDSIDLSIQVNELYNRVTFEDKLIQALLE